MILLIKKKTPGTWLRLRKLVGCGWRTMLLFGEPGGKPMSIGRRAARLVVLMTRI